MLINELQNLGLHENEAKVYLCLMRVGEAPATLLAHRTNLKRATVYSILEQLTQENLVGFKKEKRYRRYFPNDPIFLVHRVQEQQNQLRYQMNLARECAQKLKHLNGKSLNPNPMIKLFEGNQAISEALKNFIKPDLTTQIYFPELAKPSRAGDFLHVELKALEKLGRKLQVKVPNQHLRFAKQSFPRSMVEPLKQDQAKGALIFQENRCCFIYLDQIKLKMVEIKEDELVKFLKSSLEEPTFSSSQ